MLVSLATVILLVVQSAIVQSVSCTLSKATACNTVAGPAFGFGASFVFGTPANAILDGSSCIARCTLLVDSNCSIDGGIGGFGGNAIVFNGPDDTGGFVDLTPHSFTTVCDCDTTLSCPSSIDPEPSGCSAGSYAIKTSGTPGFVCLKFGDALPTTSDNNAAIAMTQLTGLQLTVTIGADTDTYDFGAVATTNSLKEIQGLYLVKNSIPNPKGLFFSACGPLIVETGTSRKRAITGADTQLQSLGPATLKAASATGDPHLAGPNGIKLDVYGKPAANYSLVVAPSFQVNMQLADRGPDMRFMKKLTVLYRGTSFTIVPWTVKTQRDALVAHFEALGAKVTFDLANLRIIIEICAGHTIEFVSSHTDIPFAISYLDFAMTVPGCHDAYGGLLGQTYQCKYATEKFEWSRDREDAFLVPKLETPSGSYSATTSCANEDEYRGEVIRGSSVGGGNSTLEMTATQQERRRRL